MRYVSRKFVATALIVLAAGASATAQVPEARFLPFGEELKRARRAIGAEADCRVFIEDVFASCSLRTAGGHAITVHFSDTATGLEARKSLRLVRGTIEPQQFSAALAVYGIPTEVAAPCISAGVTSSPGTQGRYEAYVGDYFVLCDSNTVRITYARRF